MASGRGQQINISCVVVHQIAPYKVTFSRGYMHFPLVTCGINFIIRCFQKLLLHKLGSAHVCLTQPMVGDLVVTDGFYLRPMAHIVDSLPILLLI